MGLDTAHYHGWRGELRSPWLASLAMVRVALLQVFRRKAYWIVLALGLLNFVFFWSAIYFVTQTPLPPEARTWLLENSGFAAQTAPGQEDGYTLFMESQSLVVMMLLAFSGSLLVGSDFRLKTLPFYLSRRIDRRHYIVAKLLSVSCIVSLLTTLPALLLFVEYGLFTSSLDYWIENWRLPLSIVGYGLVLCLVLSILLVTLSAYLERAAPIAITWSTLFVLLRGASRQLSETTENPYWKLLDLWRNMRLTGRLMFDELNDPLDRELAWYALGILSLLCVTSLALLVRRVRAVDVVE